MYIESPARVLANNFKAPSNAASKVISVSYCNEVLLSEKHIYNYLISKGKLLYMVTFHFHYFHFLDCLFIESFYFRI